MTRNGKNGHGKGVAALIPDVAATLTICQAHLARALRLLAVLEPAVHGYQTVPVQEAKSEARGLLVETGKRAPDEANLWVDRASKP